MKPKSSAPLLLAALLILTPPIATLTIPAPIEAKTGVENPGQEMDGDPDTWDLSPSGIRAPNSEPVETQPRTGSQNHFEFLKVLILWLQFFLRNI
jgi:hypothetical protein